MRSATQATALTVMAGASGGRTGRLYWRGWEEAETAEGARGDHRGYFTQSSQRTEAGTCPDLRRRFDGRCQRGGGPRYARHGSRDARFTSAAGTEWHL